MGMAKGGEAVHSKSAFGSNWTVGRLVGGEKRR